MMTPTSYPQCKHYRAIRRHLLKHIARLRDEEREAMKGIDSPDMIDVVWHRLMERARTVRIVADDLEAIAKIGTRDS